MKITRWMILAAVAGTGCAHPPRPYVFNTHPKADAVSVRRRLPSRQGHQVAAIDRQKAEIVTYWEDTRYRFRETDDLEDETNVFLRYHVQVRQARQSGHRQRRSAALRPVPSRRSGGRRCSRPASR